MRRRELLASIGSIGAVSLAGCSGSPFTSLQTKELGETASNSSGWAVTVHNAWGQRTALYTTDSNKTEVFFEEDAQLVFLDVTTAPGALSTFDTRVIFNEKEYTEYLSTFIPDTERSPEGDVYAVKIPVNPTSWSARLEWQTEEKSPFVWRFGPQVRSALANPPIVNDGIISAPDAVQADEEFTVKGELNKDGGSGAVYGVLRANKPYMPAQPVRIKFSGGDSKRVSVDSLVLSPPVWKEGDIPITLELDWGNGSATTTTTITQN